VCDHDLDDFHLHGGERWNDDYAIDLLAKMKYVPNPVAEL
jgi:hypothetical protein